MWAHLIFMNPKVIIAKAGVLSCSVPSRPPTLQQQKNMGPW